LVVQYLYRQQQHCLHCLQDHNQIALFAFAALTRPPLKDTASYQLPGLATTD
jgi:hypothetical protein